MKSLNEAALWTLLLLALSAPASASAADAKTVDFAKDVQPILKESCVKCHSLDPAKPKHHAAAGFRLDDKAKAMKGGRSGVAIIPGNAKDSLFVKLLSGSVTVDDHGKDHDLDPMPKQKKGEDFKPLPADQIAILTQWVDQGAAWPDEAAPKDAAPKN